MSTLTLALIIKTVMLLKINLAQNSCGMHLMTEKFLHLEHLVLVMIPFHVHQLSPRQSKTGIMRQMNNLDIIHSIGAKIQM